jgi:protein-L-isoaspartate(D-aspartate) O-methyltransferase
MTVEIDPKLADSASARLSAHDFQNVQVEVGDGSRGWSPDLMFDAIVLTGSTPILPDTIVAQLKPGGRLFAIVGIEPAMHGRLVTKDESGAAIARDLFETVVVPLVNAPQPERFVF